MTREGMVEAEQIKWLRKKRGATEDEKAKVKEWDKSKMNRTASSFESIWKYSASA